MREPDRCAKLGSIAAVRLALKRDGWQECWGGALPCSRRDTDYYKPGVPIEVSEKLEHGTYVLHLTPRPQAEINEFLNAMSEREKKQAAEAKVGASLVEGMKH